MKIRIANSLTIIYAASKSTVIRATTVHTLQKQHYWSERVAPCICCKAFALTTPLLKQSILNTTPGCALVFDQIDLFVKVFTDSNITA